MQAGSLFSGVGGLDLGLHRAGITHAFFCESDPWRRTVLAHHWPGVPIYEDVRDVALQDEGRGSLHRAGGSSEREQGVGRGERRGEAAVDLLCGGFPCQDLSVAGNRAGLAGARSGLFHEFARIAQSLQPRWLLIENVPGLLSSNSGRDFGIVLGTLADIGYGMAWRVVDSRFFGVPQRRRRVFIVGALADGDPRAAAQRAGQILAVGTRCPRHPATSGEARTDIAGTLGGGAGERGWAQDVERMTFIPSVANTLLKHDSGVDEPSTTNYLVHGFHQTQDPISEPNGTPALGRTSIGMGLGQGTAVRRLTPVECERLQAWPDGFTNPDGTSPDSRRYAAAGDGVTASVGEWIGRRLMAA